MFVQIERDADRGGWHIWVLSKDPRVELSDGWDIWVEEPAQVIEWLGASELDVEWID
jgi:hypothetical protein